MDTDVTFTPPVQAEAPLPFRRDARVTARACFAAFLSFVALWIARDFLSPLGWAIIIAVATWPLYVRFAAMFPRREQSGVAALLFTLIVGLLIFLPVGLALHRAAEDGQAIAEALARFRTTGIPEPSWMSGVPVLGEHASRWWRVNLSDAQAIHQWIGAADSKNNADAARVLGLEIAHRTFMFVFALVSLFCFLRHGPWMARRVMETADKLMGYPGDQLTLKMIEAIRGTVNGTVSVAVVEGLLIGIAYVVAGVPYPLVFTILTIAFAMLPFGAWAVFTLASLLLVMQGDGNSYAALGVFTFGAAVMLIGDTFLWPAFVGNAARLPFIIALAGIFGGLQAFGLIGLFLGPIVMAAAVIVWRDWIIASGRATAAQTS